MHLDRFDLLIDGYNLMHAAGFAREQYGPRGLELQRERFLDWLWRRVPPNLRTKTVVVFDAGGTDAQYVGLGSHHELRLLFSPRGAEADDLIEELIELHSNPRQLQVVSSDHRLHRAARKRKATCVDSEAFISLIARLARQARELRRQAEEMSKPSGELPEETQAWLAVFAEAEELVQDARMLEQAEALLLPEGPGGSAPSAASTRAGGQPRDRTGASGPASPGRSSSTPPLSTPRPSTAAAPGPAPPPGASSPGGAVDADELQFWEERLRDLLPPPR